MISLFVKEIGFSRKYHVHVLTAVEVSIKNSTGKPGFIVAFVGCIRNLRAPIQKKTSY